MSEYNIDFSKGLVPTIIQDYESGKVLMLAYMNEESFRRTMDTKKTWFYSRSRQKLWNKGESSGHFQHVKEVYIDCDRDTILIGVKQDGVACHTGAESCFYTKILG
ncbi:phosphoribosyl-AMP cyclohydrolase [Anaeromicrobium sediminis]|uniref:Phosphoribosyl-AMP cyclohydrolase n=1 Tax=Anaeromicrobium sediminis TaxID=1478221 RepID=A0A267MJE1_9FIRM|nr:phosphoribosyl-AMP cyclohydrolase [Anaeromicrobium sediminis]PAB59714.1 phosphoribosyl-AMP cyclohydrolase [Anaeromicrobium sediminis]